MVKIADEYCTLYIERIIKITGKAVLALVDEEEIWIPKSHIDETDLASFEEDQVDVECEVKTWFYEQHWI